MNLTQSTILSCTYFSISIVGIFKTQIIKTLEHLKNAFSSLQHGTVSIQLYVDNWTIKETFLN